MPGPSGVSSSSSKVTVCIPAICPTICFRSLVVVPSGTCASFRIFIKASLSFLMIKYGSLCSLLFELFNDCVFTSFQSFDELSSIIFTDPFFLSGSSARTSFPFLFFSSTSFNWLIHMSDSCNFLRFPKLDQSHLPQWLTMVSWPTTVQKSVRQATHWVRKCGFSRAGPPITSGF